jgi:xylulokinase
MVYDGAGTASIFATVLEDFATDTTYHALMTSSHVVPGLYFAMAYVAGGGLNLRWFRDSICGPEKEAWLAAGKNPYQALGELAGAVPAGSNKLMFLPHFSGRNTPNDPNQRGAFIGLTWGHEKGQMYRAIMESIGYEYALYLKAVRQIAPDIEVSEVISIGGGARSSIFKQIKADILGLPYRGLDRDEFGTLGAAIVAGKAAGLFDDVAKAARSFVQSQERATEPDLERHMVYRRYVELYGRLIDNTSALFKELIEIP